MSILSIAVTTIETKVAMLLGEAVSCPCPAGVSGRHSAHALGESDEVAPAGLSIEAEGSILRDERSCPRSFAVVR